MVGTMNGCALVAWVYDEGRFGVLVVRKYSLGGIETICVIMYSNDWDALYPSSYMFLPP
jgi:hypothetical protein